MSHICEHYNVRRFNALPTECRERLPFGIGDQEVEVTFTPKDDDIVEEYENLAVEVLNHAKIDSGQHTNYGWLDVGFDLSIEDNEWRWIAGSGDTTTTLDYDNPNDTLFGAVGKLRGTYTQALTNATGPDPNAHNGVALEFDANYFHPKLTGPSIWTVAPARTLTFTCDKATGAITHTVANAGVTSHGDLSTLVDIDVREVDEPTKKVRQIDVYGGVAVAGTLSVGVSKGPLGFTLSKNWGFSRQVGETVTLTCQKGSGGGAPGGP